MYRCYLAVAIPLFLACIVDCRTHLGWSLFAIWFAKPWLDRTILFALARAAFGTDTSLRDLWQARRSVWGGQLLTTLIFQRLSMRRSFKQPVLQLEGLGWRARHRRLMVLGKRMVGAARGQTEAYALAEACLAAGIVALAYWFAPQPQAASMWEFLRGQGSGTLPYITVTGYALAVCFLEPFYVASGFGLYLSRRVDIEAWDIEQEFRAVFAS